MLLFAVRNIEFFILWIPYYDLGLWVCAVRKNRYKNSGLYIHILYKIKMSDNIRLHVVSLIICVGIPIYMKPWHICVIYRSKNLTIVTKYHRPRNNMYGVYVMQYRGWYNIYVITKIYALGEWRKRLLCALAARLAR